jgi:hypothetical protein
MPTDSESFKKCAEYFKDNRFSLEMKIPDEMKEKLQTINEKAPYILAEFKSAFVLYNKNPEYPDYQQMFANIKANITNISSQLFTALNDAQMNTDELNKKMLCLNALIVQERNKNRILKQRNGIVEEKNNASSEQIYDYTRMYEEGYLRNWGLIISIIIIGFLVKNMYSNISGEMIPDVANVANNVKNMGSNFYNKAKNIGK